MITYQAAISSQTVVIRLENGSRIDENKFHRKTFFNQNFSKLADTFSTVTSCISLTYEILTCLRL